MSGVRPFRRALSISLSFSAAAWIASCSSMDPPIDAIRTDQFMIADAIYAYQARTGRLPDRLIETCSPDCAADWLSDPWGHLYEYSRTGTSFELRSIGADGVRSTPDDIIYSPERERAEVLRVAGCYHVLRFPAVQERPQILILDSLPLPTGTHAYRVQPQLLQDEGWWVPVGDSLKVTWGSHYSMILLLKATNDQLDGVLVEATEHSSTSRGSVSARRVRCG